MREEAEGLIQAVAQRRYGVNLTSQKRRCALYALACVLVAAAVRGAHLFFVWDTPLLEPYVTDLEMYRFYAEKILSGEFLFIIPQYGNIFYSLYIAFCMMLFGEAAVQAAATLQVLLDSLSAGLVFFLGWRMAEAAAEKGFATINPQLAGLAAGCLYAVYGPIVFYAALPLGESLSMFCVLVGLALLFHGLDRGGSGLLLLFSGVSLSLAFLLRPNSILLLPLLALALLLYAKDRGFALRNTLPSLFFGVVLPLLPFTAHNLVTVGSLSPFGLHGGYNFYMGNHAEASGLYEQVEGVSNKPFVSILESIEVASKSVGIELSAPQANSWWLRRGLSFWGEQPVSAMLLTGKKTLLFLSNEVWALNLDYVFCKQFSPIMYILPAGFGLLAALALVGMFSMRLSRNPYAASLLAVTIGLCLGVIIFFVAARYRIASAGLLCIWAGVGVAALTCWANEKHWPKIMAAVAPAIVLAFVSVFSAGLAGGDAEEMRAANHLTLGLHYATSGKKEKSIVQLQKAAKLKPERWTIHTRIARTSLETHNLGLAQESYVKAKQTAPDSLQAAAELAHIEWGLGYQRQAACRLATFGKQARDLQLYAQMVQAMGNFSLHECHDRSAPLENE